MTKSLIIALFFISFAKINAQDFSRVELDSLYKLFTFVRGVNVSDMLQKQVDENPESKKCGMQLVNSIIQNLENFSFEQQQVLSRLLQRPITQTSTVSPNGFFRVHYDLNGDRAIGYDLGLLLQAVDSVLNYEITALGFPPPPSDDTSGGDSKYDIYVLNIADYGYTQGENKISNSRWSSFMVIDNDYPAGSYFTQGINAARVTVAHEFHHAIQMGSYAPSEINSPYRNEDVYFYELTSTAFEEFVFDDVNDYYAYMPSYFNHPEYPMPIQSGYNMAIWNIYLQKNFGFDILKRQWELMPAKRALESIALSINEIGSTFGNELNKFSIWTYFTGYRTFPGRYFEEASKYPLIDPTASVDFTPPSQTFNMSVGPVTNYFLKIKNPSRNDTIVAIITNSDYIRGIDSVNKTFNFSYQLFADTISGIRKLGSIYSSNLNTVSQTFWNASEIINNIVVNGDTTSFPPPETNSDYSFPQPFSYKKNYVLGSFISIPVKTSFGESIVLNIYSSAMELIYSNAKIVQFLANSSRGIIWDVQDNNGEKLSSGVYIYVIKSGDDIYKGKLVIFND